MTYLINIADFTSRADLASNILTSKINSYIGITQTKFVKGLLCTETYETLLQEFASGLNYMSVEYAALLPFVQDFLVYKTYARALINTNFVSTAGGIRTTKDNISDVASDRGMSMLIKQADSDANFYQDELVNYLTRNKETYTVWRDSQCGCNEKFVSNLNTFSGVGGRRNLGNVNWM
jgi:hypothetical protein